MQQQAIWLKEKLKDKPYTRWDAMRCAGLAACCVVHGGCAMLMVVAGGGGGPLPNGCMEELTLDSEEWVLLKNAELYGVASDVADANMDAVYAPRPEAMTREEDIPLAVLARSVSIQRSQLMTDLGEEMRGAYSQPSSSKAFTGKGETPDPRDDRVVRNFREARDSARRSPRAEPPSLDNKLSAVVRFTLRMGVVAYYLYELKEGRNPPLRALLWPLFVAPLFV